MKRCGHCRQEKSYDDFSKNKTAKDGLHWTCKECHNRASKEAYRSNPGIRTRKLLYSKRQREANPLIEQERKRLYYKNRMGAILVALGDKCAKCGITDRRVLQIDHINGDGSKHRKRNNNSWQRMCTDFEKSIKTRNDEYRLLCANCNWIDGIERGYRKSVWF